MGINKTKEHKENIAKASCEKVVQLTKENVFVKEWSSAKEAANYLGVTPAGISYCINPNKPLKSIGGFKFMKSNVYYKQPSKEFVSYFNIDLNKQYKFWDVIISKEVLKSTDRETLEKFLPDFLRCIRYFSSQFPYYENNIELAEIINSLQKTKSCYSINSKEFNNMASSAGNGYLKSIFHNFYASNYKGNATALSCWEDDRDMLGIIKYRIGLNNSNEVFDFSLHQMIRGMSSSKRVLISFFKPAVAGSIYREFLGNKENPVVIDPCAGFGGRMLGFAANYPKGTYIGIEPNIETYNNLLKLKEEIQLILPDFKCELFNCCQEDYKGDKECDLTFTSIPYWDWEEYAGKYITKLSYKNFNDWEDKFINSMLTYKNLLVNLPVVLYDQLKIKGIEKDTYSLISNKTHFSKSKGEKKKELILKFY